MNYMHNVLITGSKGQLGLELNEIANKYSNYNCFFTDVSDLDISDHILVNKFIEKNEIKTIINCAAYTAVDMAEKDFDMANQINHLAVANLSEIAKNKKIRLIHISTDYVFDGKSKTPYNEDDMPNPQTVYGKTKLFGEKIMKKINPLNSIIIRTSWVYSIYGNNFFKTVLGLSKTNNKINIIDDQFGTPTYAANLAKVIFDIIPKIKNNKVELFHYSNEGECSWFDFASEIFRDNSVIDINPIKSCDYPTKAIRPIYSVLNKDKIKISYNLEIPYWKESLERCKNKLGL